MDNIIFLQKRLNEYRMTRATPYVDPSCTGYEDLTVRQGYYIEAQSASEALRKMREMFPDDEHGFSCQLWKENVR